MLGFDTLLGIHFAPCCLDKDLCSFAMVSREMALMVLSDAVWQVRLSASHPMVLQDLICSGQPGLRHCQILYSHLAMISKRDHQVLKKPKGAIAGWEVHEVRDWWLASKQWLLLQQKQAAMLHLGLLEQQDSLTAAIQVQETELHALKLLAQWPGIRGAQILRKAVLEAPDVRRVLEQKVRRRRQKGFEITQILANYRDHFQLGTEHNQRSASAERDNFQNRN